MMSPGLAFRALLLASTAMGAFGCSPDGLNVLPAAPSLAAGLTVRLSAARARGGMAEMTFLDPAKVAWTVADPSLAKVDAEGVVTALRPGMVAVTAAFEGLSGTATLTITEAQLRTIAIDPPAAVVPRGLTQTFVATGFFSDGSRREKLAVTWSSSSAEVAPIGPGGIASAKEFGQVIITASVGTPPTDGGMGDGVSARAALAVSPADLVSLEIAPAKPSVPVGTTIQFTATGVFTDATKIDMTSLVTWDADDPKLVKFANVPGLRGLATTLALGPTRVTAVRGMIKGLTEITVSDAKLKAIQVTPAAPAIARGTTRQLTATGLFSDGSTSDLTMQASWTSSNVALLTVGDMGPKAGLALGVAPGQAKVSATLQGVTGETTATVTDPTLISLAITPPNMVIARGTSVGLQAIGTYSDNSNQNLTSVVMWSSSEQAVATVSNALGAQGLAGGVAKGTSTISALFAGVTGTTSLTISDAALVTISVTPINATLSKGSILAFTATGTYSDKSTQDLTTQVLWTSSTPAAATVSNAQGAAGAVTAVAKGQSVIKAAMGNVSGSTTLFVSDATLLAINLSPTNPTLAKGSSFAFQAVGTYSDQSTQDLTSAVTWTSSSAPVATVSNAQGSRGLVTTIAKGQATITGKLLAVSGTTIVTVSDAALVSISVTPGAPVIAKGTKVDFIATGTYSDKTTQDLTQTASWTSSDGKVLSVSNAMGSAGSATGVAKGQANITAAVGAVSGLTKVVVSDATLTSIAITPPVVTIAKGTTILLVATGSYSDKSTQDLTSLVSWASSDSDVAAVSNAPGARGSVKAVQKGSVTISASLGGVTGNATVNISDAKLVALTITPSAPTLAKGTGLQLNAYGTYSDQSSQDVTTTVAWSSSNAGVATVSNANGSIGIASGVAGGQTTITAALDGVKGTVILSVNSAALQALSLSPTNPTIAKGTTRQFVATGTYTDKSTQDLTSLVAWSSSDLKVATVSNAGGTRGLADGVAQGMATISAALQGVTGTTVLTVSDATLVALAITPTTPAIAKGTTKQLTATGIYSDKSTQDLTALVSWTTSNGMVASISSAQGSEGLATGLAKGQTTIGANLQGVTGSTVLTITDATLVAIGVDPEKPVIAKGTLIQFVATGTYSDLTTQDVTSLVSWASSNANVAAVSNGGGSRGLATALIAGATTISASLGGVTGSTSLTVSSAVLASITVTPVAVAIAKGSTIEFRATGTFSDKSSQDITGTVTWSSSDGAVATVDSGGSTPGRATGIAKGQTTISATQSMISGSTGLAVTDATLATLAVTPVSPLLAKGTTMQFVAIGTYSDSTTQDLTSSVTWTSSNLAIATISNVLGSRGLTSGVGVGAVTIAAGLGNISGSTVLTVTNATLTSISVEPATPALAKGTSVQFTATALYSDQTTQDVTSKVTWASSDKGVAVVSNGAGTEGFASALAKGQSKVTATLTGVIGSITLTVTDATLVSITVTPPNPTNPKGTTRQFGASGKYSDGSTQDLTTLATWVSSTPAVVAISNTQGTRGLASALTAGTATIAASLGDTTSGSTTMTVTNATLKTISIGPANATIAKATQLYLTATGTYSDGSQLVITSAVTWASSNNNTAVISNAPGEEGLATGVAAGAITVTATQTGINGTTMLTVTNATLSSIAVTPAAQTIVKGATLQFTAIGTFSSGPTQDLTKQVTWDSSDSAIASISNQTLDKGLATAVGSGTANISASLLAKTATVTLKVP
ncbi:MAG: hypothetical protein EXR72_04335 [Myxococcales bacterium]|nr:hypothetical protein [Myxococcales bacterium]